MDHDAALMKIATLDPDKLERLCALDLDRLEHLIATSEPQDATKPAEQAKDQADAAKPAGGPDSQPATPSEG